MDSCPNRTIHSQSRALTYDVNAEAKAFRRVPDAVLCSPEIPFRCSFPFPGLCWLSRQTLWHFVCAQPVPGRTGKCSSSARGMDRGHRREGNGGVLLLWFIPHVKTSPCEPPTRLISQTAAGKLSHPAADTAVGTSLESKCFVRINAGAFLEEVFQVPVRSSYPQPAQQTHSLE